MEQWLLPANVLFKEKRQNSELDLAWVLNLRS